MDQNNTELFLHPFTWDIVDEAGDFGGIQIQCWAFDRDSKIHLLRIEDYPATCFVELPEKIEGNNVDWFDHNVDEFFRSLVQKLGKSAPAEYNFSTRHKLYYYHEKKFPMVHLSFTTLQAMNDCVKLLTRPFYFKGKGRAKVRVWEHKVPYLRKFLTRVRLEPAQWFQVDAKKILDDKVSVVENEFIASWKNIQPLTNEQTTGWMVYPKILVFDIEAYSKNKKAFPDKFNTTDVCYMISVITQRIGKKETRKRRVILFGNCRDLDNAEVIRVDSEFNCIDTFSRLVIEEDPDIISGYNHHGFDNDYLNARLERLMEEWREMGRLIGQKVEMESRTWASAAYGHNEVNILKMNGRISIDMLPVVKRDFKLPKYDLDTVGKFFLGRGKHPVKAEHIFSAYENYWNTLAAYKAKLSPEEKKSLHNFKSDGSPEGDALEKAIDEMTRITCYCLEDAEITLDIAEKVHVWIASVELSNIVGVSIMDLYTRGQQVRCLSKIYDEAHRQGYVLDFQEPLNVVFNGGAVEKPEPGVEDEVPAFDVNSMYPNIMIKENIDYTTFVPDHLAHTVRDEDCNIIEFDQLERPKKANDKTSEEDFDADAEIGGEGVLVHRRLRFVKKHIREGIIPKILRGLLDARKAVKNQMKPLEKAKEEGKPYDAVQLVVLNQRQLALKCTANSFFGFCGAYIGKLPLIEAAMAVTAEGRRLVGEFKRYLREKYDARIVYGDTDSVMPKFNLEGMSWQEKWAFWERVNKELSSMFPGIVLEMEKVMRIICFAPKMYAYLSYTKDGLLTNDPKKLQARGIVLARRDGTPWVRNHYRAILFNILWNYSPDLKKQAESMEMSFNMIVDAALELQSGKVDWQDLAKINEMGANYKNPNFPMAVLGNHLRQIGRPAQAGDRLRYVICDIPGEKSVGRKMRTDDEFLESQETENPLKLDVNYYLKNALLKKIDPLFQVGYNKILPLLDGIGYKPNSRKHFVGVTDPVKLIVRVLEDGGKIENIKSWFRESLVAIFDKPRTKPKKKIILRKSTCVDEARTKPKKKIILRKSTCVDEARTKPKKIILRKKIQVIKLD